MTDDTYPQRAFKTMAQFECAVYYVPTHQDTQGVTLGDAWVATMRDARTGESASVAEYVGHYYDTSEETRSEAIVNALESFLMGDRAQAVEQDGEWKLHDRFSLNLAYSSRGDDDAEDIYGWWAAFVPFRQPYFYAQCVPAASWLILPATQARNTYGIAVGMDFETHDDHRLEFKSPRLNAVREALEVRDGAAQQERYNIVLDGLPVSHA